MHDPMTQVLDFPSYPFRRALAKRLHLRRLDSLFEVWHHDPSDYDSTTCGRDYRSPSHWQHWRIRVPAVQRLRRRLFQRCAECGGWSTRSNPVNISAGWDYRDFKWWRSHPNVRHKECAARHNRSARSKAEHWKSVGANDTAAAVYRWAQCFQPGDRWDPQDLTDLVAAIRAAARTQEEA